MGKENPKMSDSEEYQTEDSAKRRRKINNKAEGFEYKKTVRTPAKITTSEDKLDLMMEMIAEIKRDMEEIQLENRQLQEEIDVLKEENENLRKLKQKYR